jgi:hypothetical protein
MAEVPFPFDALEEAAIDPVLDEEASAEAEEATSEAEAWPALAELEADGETSGAATLGTVRSGEPASGAAARSVPVYRRRLQGDLTILASARATTRVRV